MRMPPRCSWTLGKAVAGRYLSLAEREISRPSRARLVAVGDRSPPRPGGFYDLAVGCSATLHRGGGTGISCDDGTGHAERIRSSSESGKARAAMCPCAAASVRSGFGRVVVLSLRGSCSFPSSGWKGHGMGHAGPVDWSGHGCRGADRVAACRSTSRTMNDAYQPRAIYIQALFVQSRGALRRIDGRLRTGLALADAEWRTRRRCKTSSRPRS